MYSHNQTWISCPCARHCICCHVEIVKDSLPTVKLKWNQACIFFLRKSYCTMVCCHIMPVCTRVCSASWRDWSPKSLYPCLLSHSEIIACPLNLSNWIHVDSRPQIEGVYKGVELWLQAWGFACGWLWAHYKCDLFIQFKLFAMYLIPQLATLSLSS